MPDPSTVAATIGALVDRLVARELARLKSPAVRAQVAHELHEHLAATSATVRAVRGSAIRELRAAAVTWPAIGTLLDVTPQRAQQLAAPSLTEAIEG